MCRSRCHWIAVFLTSLAFALPLAAQTPVQYAVDRWNTESGLPQNSVNAIMQSRDGRLWLATLGGIARFDGTAFSSITTGDRIGLRSDRAYALAEDRDGHVWIATEGGLSRYDRGAIKTFSTDNGLPENAIRAVAEHPDGTIWFGTQHGALGHIDSSGVEVVAPSGGIFGNAVAQIVVDVNGVIWVNADTGTWRIDSRQSAPVLAQPRAQHSVNLPSIATDPQGGVWTSTESGFALLTSGGSRDYPLPRASDLKGQNVRALAADGKGTLWIGGDSSEVWRVHLDSGETEVVKAAEQGTTTSLLRDREGSIWAGNRVGGLIRVRPALFQVFTTSAGLAHDNAVGVFTDSTGRVWVGNKCDGAAVLQDGHFRKLTPPEIPLCVWTFAEDREGNIWMGGKGLGRWHNGTFKLLDSMAGVRAIFRDSDGTMWIGSSLGLQSWDGKELQLRAGRDQDPHPDVHTIYQARDGTLWLGTEGGLLHHTKNGFELFTTAQGLPFDDVRGIYEDSAGTFWIATYGGGLARMQGRQFHAFGTGDGLHDNFLSSIVEDNSGNFWLSGNRGIFRVSRRDLEEKASGRASPLHSVIYGRADGMLSTETNGGFQPAVTRTADGRLWYPTLVGVAVIDPATAVSSIAPTISIERVIVDGQTHDPSEDLRIPPGPGAADVEIAYSGLSLNSPNSVTFRYRLDGQDRDWVDAGTRRSANYSNLVPGDYRFHVIAANRDGAASLENSALTFTVLPHPWQTWWFRTLFVLALVAIPILRDRRQRRRQAELTLAVAQKTHELREQAVELQKQNELLEENVRLKDDVERISRHDLRTPLNSIISLAQVARETPGLPAQHEASLQLIEQAGYRAMNMANLTLDLFKMEQGTYRLNSAAVDIRLVLDRVLLDLEALMRTREVGCEVSGERLFVHGDELLSHSMLSNLVKNAVEASPSGEKISVGIGAEGELVRIRIHNRGAIPESLRDRFFEKYATGGKSGGTGLGAYSARLMAETQGGSIQVETSEAAGTTITVSLRAASSLETAEQATQEEGGIQSLPIGTWPRRSILLVDDDPNNRMLLRHFLSHPNWLVDEAENGPLALRKLKEKPYDFVFLDVEMPVMNGFEVASQIRADGKASRKAIVVGLSSHDDPITRDRALRAGCDQYVPKPISRKAIVELVLGSSTTIVLDSEIRDLIPPFLKKQQAEVEQLKDALLRNDADEVRHTSHRMRGSFSLYGFGEASEICAEIERLSQAHRLSDARERLQALSDYLGQLDIRYTQSDSQSAPIT